jgi:hypothetical protein
MPELTPDGYPIDHCRSCAATIVWATTKAGRSAPVDAAPSEGGNVELNHGPNGPTATVVIGDSLFAGPLRKSHFASCADATEWRARK